MARFSTTGGSGSGSALNYVQVAGGQATVTSAPSSIIDLDITTTGKPVQISVTGEGSNASAGSWVRINLFRDGSAIGNEMQLEASATSENVPYSINFIDDVAAGTYNYSIRATDKSSGNWQFGEVAGPVMNAVELTGLKGDDGAQGEPGTDGSASLVVPTAIRDQDDADFITFERTSTGTARIATPQDDLSLRSARDITLFAGDDGPGNVYIGWGDAVYTPDSPNKVATMGDILSNVLPTNMNNDSDQTVLTFEQSYTGTARIIAPLDDLALKSANDILLYPGEEGPGNVYIGWGDATGTPDASNRVATIGDIQAASTGDITFVNTTISTDSEDDIVIENKNNDGLVKARITLDQSNEQVLIEAISIDSEWFNDTQWATAIWSGNAVTINNTPDIINFFNNLNGDVTSVSVNDGTPVQYDGAGYDSENISINVIGTPSEDPLTVTTIRFYYSQSSRIDIDNDDNTFDIVSMNMSINIDSSGDVDIKARDEDITLRASDDIYFNTNWDTNEPDYEWRMNSNGNFELPRGGIIVNPENSSGDGYGNSTLHLIPDEDILFESSSNQYIIIDPTAPNHIHLRAGGIQDSSTADLFLGAERTNVRVSDGSGDVQVTSKRDDLVNSYVNLNPDSTNYFTTTTDAAIEFDAVVNVDGVDYTVVSVQYDTPDTGYKTAEITGGVFASGNNYTFRVPQGENEWIFDSNGTLYGPTEPGWLQVSGIYGEPGSNTNIVSQENLVLSAGENQGVFINNSNDGNNQVATIGDLPAAPDLSGYQQKVTNVSDTEIGYLDGVTSAIQTQLNGKQPVVANVSNAEIGYLANVTSDIQTQINEKAALGSPTITMASFVSASATTDPVTISTANGHGGAGFAGLMKLENSTAGATNTKKFVRLDSVGSLEIVSDDYSRTIFSLADSGNLSSIGTVNGSTIGDSGWQTVSSFSNGYSGNSVAYRRVNNVLYMRGNISGGTANTAAFTLPTGYRPSTIEHVVLVQKFGTMTGSYVTVGTNGEVVPMENAAWLSGISYPL